MVFSYFRTPAEYLRFPEKEGRQKGHDGQGDEQRGDQARRQWPGPGPGSASRDPWAKTMGRKTTMVVRVEAVMAMPTSEAHHDRRLAVLPFLDVPEGVLDDDDGVIHQHADPQGQPSQGQEVQGVAGGVKGDEGGDDGQRNGQGDDQRRPPVPEEEEDQDDGQQAALPGVIDGFLVTSGSCRTGP